MVGGYIQESKEINDAFSCRYINLLSSSSIQSTGKVRISKLTGFVFVMLRVIFELVQFRPRICYLALTTTGFALIRDLILVIIMKIFGRHLVIHLHNKGVKQRTGLIHRLIYKTVFYKSTVIVLSDKLYDDVDAYVDYRSVHVCHNGIPQRPVKKRERSAAVRLLFLSNLLRAKGVFDFIELMSKLRQRGLNIQGVIVGAEGDIEAELLLKEIRDSGLDDAVQYVGALYGEDKDEQLEMADVLIYPTYADCFPLVLIEAMRAGLPVVAYDDGGISDIVADGHTGFVIAKGDSVNLYGKTLQLVDASILRRQMSDQASALYMRKFTLERFEKRISSILFAACKCD